MKTPLHIIGNNKLYGLADSNEIEIVECVYDNIKHLKSGKYIVIKDKMAGILDERGKILFMSEKHFIFKSPKKCLHDTVIVTSSFS